MPLWQVFPAFLTCFPVILTDICGTLLAWYISMDRMRETDWSALYWFDRSEFDSPERMSRLLLMQLDRARAIARVRFVITSSYRAGDILAHGDGDAVDIFCDNSRDRWAIVASLTASHFCRIGIYPRHIHADVSERLIQRVIWRGDYETEEDEQASES